MWVCMLMTMILNHWCSKLWLLPLQCVPLHVYFFFVTDAEDCTREFLYSSFIELCHNHTDGKEYTCEVDGQGFVVDNLVMAPKTHFSKCTETHSSNYEDAKCLQQNIAEYDNKIQDLLDKVSGQKTINRSVTVDQFSFSVMSAEGKRQDSSTFVLFKKTCKPGE